jgi:MFS family permease
MSPALDTAGPAPETREPRFLWLLFGCCAAPLFWLGQMMLAYGVSAYVCYPADHPVMLAKTEPLFAALLLFDALAMGLCLAGGLVSWRALQGRNVARNRFLALAGLMSSLWFAAAVLFNIVASLMVPSCQG